MYGAQFMGGFISSNTDRINALRPIGEGYPLQPRLQAKLFGEYRDFVAQIGLIFDTSFDTDPDGLDVVRRLMTRNEDSYLGYNHRIFQVYWGRFQNHWSLADQPGVMITNNSRSFDNLSLGLNFGQFSITL